MEKILNLMEDPSQKRLEAIQEIEQRNRFGIKFVSTDYVDTSLERASRLQTAFQKKGILKIFPAIFEGIKFFVADLKDNFQSVPYTAVQLGYTLEFDRQAVILWFIPPVVRHNSAGPKS